MATPTPNEQILNAELLTQPTASPTAPTVTPTANIAQVEVPQVTPITAPTTLSAPSTPAQLSTFLNQTQTQLNSADTYNPNEALGDKVDNFATDQLGMDAVMPTPPKYTELFTTLREQYGIENIETGINEYKNLIRNEELLLKSQKNYARGQTVRQGVIEGRVDQVTRDRMETIDWYKNNVSFLTDQANSAYSFINTLVQLNKMDYDTAKEQYQTDFNNRLNIYSALKTQEKDERDFQYQLNQDKIKMASTNLSMYVDLISKGQLKWSNLSDTEQTAIHKMEVESGLGSGFLSTVKPPMGSEIKQIIQRTDPKTGIGYADILYIDQATGQIKTKTQKLGKSALSLAEQQSLNKSSGGGGGSSTTKNSYGYTQSQWNTKVSSAMSYAKTLEKQYEADIVKAGGNTGTGKTGGDGTLAGYEVEKMEKEFIRKYGKGVGTDLLIQALNKGGYKAWSFKDNKAISVKDWSTYF